MRKSCRCCVRSFVRSLRACEENRVQGDRCAKMCVSAFVGGDVAVFFVQGDQLTWNGGLAGVDFEESFSLIRNLLPQTQNNKY